MRIALFGPHLGSNPGWVVSQGEVLQGLLSEHHEVRSASRFPNRLVRLADTVTSAIRWSSWAQVALVAVFSGPGFAMAEVAVGILTRRRVPTVLVLRGGNLPEFASAHPDRVRRLLQKAAAVVAPSPYLRERLHPIHPDITLIPNVLPLPAYPTARRSPARPKLLWMRTFHPIYRPELAVEALAGLRRSGVTATLTIAGQDRGTMNDVVGVARSLDLDDAVSFPGFLDPTAKFQALEDHDIFLVTSRIDNTPVSALEAAASGLNVVAMRVGGIPFLFRDGFDSLLVEDGDTASMTSAVQRVLDEPALADRLSGNAISLGRASLPRPVVQAWNELFASRART